MVANNKVRAFSCPMTIDLILPNDCVLDEDALVERIETAAPQLFKGLCDACPWFQEKDKE